MERAPVRTIVGRGLRRRCGRCGAKRIFRSFFQLHERCPRCGYKFEREEGFFTGVYLVNYCVTGLLLVVEIFAFLLFAVANDGDVSLVPWLVGGAAIAILCPLLLYPYAKSTWAAIDLAARPLDPVEEAEAAQHDRR
ncbi:MAG TPA: DUF983 domain-containing protein [Acidimicrobiales bacterium]|jgi:uncharacterized protein (DUF983 family)|nr:DUF983 domain-containing protein [Acidimicrobiales bacterium]